MKTNVLSAPSEDLRHWLYSSRLRLLLSLAGSVAALVLQPRSWPLELRGLVAWNTAVACYLALAWRVILGCDAAHTRRLSTRQDDARPTINALLLLSSFASIGGVLGALTKAEQIKGALATALTVAAMATVASSWLLINTIYALHYTRLYYAGGRGSGIDFHGDEPPDYLDFCYLAFAVGATFGATDSEIGGRIIRRTILKHSILSFTYATVVVALAISVVTDIISK